MAKNETLTAKKIVDALESGALVPVPSGTVKSYVREDGVRVVTEFTLDSIGLVPPERAGLTRQEMSARGVNTREGLCLQ